MLVCLANRGFLLLDKPHDFVNERVGKLFVVDMAIKLCHIYRAGHTSFNPIQKYRA